MKRIDLKLLLPFERPQRVNIDAWERAGMEEALACVLDRIWASRPVFAAGMDRDSHRRMQVIWQGLAEVSSTHALEGWARAVRQSVWGSPDRWDDSLRTEEGNVKAVAMARARRWLGATITDWISNDGWKELLQKFASRGDDYDRLRASEQARHRVWDDSNPHHPPPSNLDDALLVERGGELAKQFGFTRLSWGGSLSREQVWSALREAEQGLASMARSLGWPDASIGGGRLSLAFALGHENLAGWLDPLNQTVHIGPDQGWGSFSHEWAHALDLAMGAHWRSDAPPKPHSTEALRTYASQAAASHPGWLTADHLDMMTALSALHLETDSAAQARRMALSLAPDALAVLGEGVPHPEWEQRIEQRRRGLRTWLRSYDKQPPQACRDGFEKWRMSGRIAFAHPDDAPARAFRDKWERWTGFIEKLAFEEGPVAQAWLQWAHVKDEASGSPYWAQPHEALARGFHAFLRLESGADTWAAGAADRPDVFPVNAELDATRAWWRHTLPAWRAVWEEPSPALTEHLRQVDRWPPQERQPWSPTASAA